MGKQNVTINKKEFADRVHGKGAQPKRRHCKAWDCSGMRSWTALQKGKKSISTG
ncbi:hypothetical protein V1226_17870 [Lachnospiraceae bacterium JLR.KK009]|nr:hypothetical protein C810_03251 [Lachnospiraceae bacterium A2]